MSREPLSRERVAELKALYDTAKNNPSREKDEWWCSVSILDACRHAYEELPSLLAAAERVAALEGLLRRCTEQSEGGKYIRHYWRCKKANWLGRVGHSDGCLRCDVEAALRAENGGDK